MRRLVSLVTVVVLGSLMTFGLQPPVQAQEATPETEMVMEGITVEDLAAS
jgi:hypothetical protein